MGAAAVIAATEELDRTGTEYDMAGTVAVCGVHVGVMQSVLYFPSTRHTRV